MHRVILQVNKILVRFKFCLCLPVLTKIDEVIASHGILQPIVEFDYVAITNLLFCALGICLIHSVVQVPGSIYYSKPINSTSNIKVALGGMVHKVKEKIVSFNHISSSLTYTKP